MNAEDRLAELMDAATRALDPPLEAMLEEGVRRGRVRRRRRRFAVAGGTAAAVLLTAGAVAFAARDGDGPRLDVGGPGTVSGAPTATAPPRSSGTSLGSASGAATGGASPSLVPLNSLAAAAILRQLVGTSLTLVSVEPSDITAKAAGVAVLGTTAAAGSAASGAMGTGSAADSTTGMVVRDGEGLAQIFVTVVNAKIDPAEALDCAKQAALLKGGGVRPSGAPVPSCSVQTLADGAVVMQEVLRSEANGVYQIRVVAARTDGVTVAITAANGILIPASAKYTRPVPPLSLDAWTTVALNRLWQPEVSLVLAKGG